MAKPAPGSPAPDFTASVVRMGHKGQTKVTLSSLKGRTVVLYFYPKDDTPGCTKQACALRDSYAEIAQKALVFGVSTDSGKSHERFIRKHQLPFSLLIDEGHHIADAYGVWVEKQLYGRRYMGTERSTFIIAPDGNIAAVLEKVKPEDHLDQLLAALS